MKIKINKINKLTWLLLATTVAVCLAIFISPVFSQSTSQCNSCHSGYYQYLDILEGNAANVLPTTINTGQTTVVTVVVQNNVNTAKYTDLSSVSLTLTSKNGHFSVANPTSAIGTLPKGIKTVTWQITGVSAGADALVITTTAKNTHQNLAFSDSYSPSPAITVQTPPPPPPTTYTVTIQLSPNGTTTPPPGILTYNAGSSVIFLATPNTSYTFNSWLVNGASNTANPLTLTINSDITLTPIFNANLPPPPPPPPTPTTFSITIQTSPNGTTTPTPGIYNYTSGTQITLNATANNGYSFNYWLINGLSNSSNPMALNITSDLSINPVFSPIPPPPQPTTFNLQIISTPNGTTTPASGNYSYNANSTVTFQATPRNGYKFNYWLVNGITNNSNPMTLKITSDLAINPSFTLISQPPPPPPTTANITILSNNNGVTTPPAGSYNVTLGSTMTLTATPNTGFIFDYWSVNGVFNATNPINITINSVLTINPVFTQQVLPPPPPSNYTVTIQSATNGTTTPIAGTYSYPTNSTIILLATPDTGYDFAYWKINGVTNPQNPLSITITQEQTAIPNFTQQPPPPLTTRTVIIQPSSNGTTTPTQGVYTYNNATKIQINATPNTNYQFDYWLINGAIVLDNPYNLTITSNLEITPIFNQIPISEPQVSTYTINIQASADGTTSPPAGTYSRTANDIFTITAQPNDNYRFDKWLIDTTANTANPITLTINKDTTITPIFTQLSSTTNTSNSTTTTNTNTETTTQTNQTNTQTQIQPLKITLNTPTSEEKWQVGTNQIITWTVTGGTNPLTIQIQYAQTNNAQNWTTIADNLNTNGSYTWKIPNDLTQLYIRATAKDSSQTPQTFTAETKVDITQNQTEQIQTQPILIAATLISLLTIITVVLVKSKETIKTKFQQSIKEMSQHQEKIKTRQKHDP